MLSEIAHPRVAQSLLQQRPVSLDGAATADGHAALVTPIAFRGEMIGALGIHDADGSRQWTEQEVGLVQAVVEQMGQVAENLRLLDETQRGAAREQTIGQITARVRESLDLQTILQTAAREVGEALNLPTVEVRLGTGPVEPVRTLDDGSQSERRR
jgi:GAF domain-containing protein